MPEAGYDTLALDGREARSDSRRGCLLRRRGAALLGGLALVGSGCLAQRTQLDRRIWKRLRGSLPDRLIGEDAAGERLNFPTSFEHAQGGYCPPGWMCSSEAKICHYPHHTQTCNHPGLLNQDGTKYFRIANDFEAGWATSAVFHLPTLISRMEFKRAGGADAGSGLYVHLLSNDQVICTAEDGTDTNEFFTQVCNELSAYAGQPVYICLVDKQRSSWGKVLIDDIRLKNQFGDELNHAGIALVTEASRPDCSQLQRHSA